MGFLLRLALIGAIAYGIGWVAVNVPIGERTLWQRITGEAKHVGDVAQGVEKSLGNPDVVERLRPSEREEMRKLIRERTPDAPK